jgi:hypothetical protein
MDKYYFATGTIDGRKVRTAQILHNFRGNLEEAGRVIALNNPGLEDMELTENGDSDTKMLEPFGPPATDLDFAPAMMAPPRTIKVKPPAGDSPRGGVDPRVGIPKQVVSAEEYAREKAKAEAGQ